jgi:nickel-dependent lactate racemase
MTSARLLFYRNLMSWKHLIAIGLQTGPTGLSSLVEVWLPYGSSEIPVRVPEERLRDILRPATRDANLDIAAEANRLLKSSNLPDLASKAREVCIGIGVSSNKQLLAELTRLLLEELVASGVPDSSITLLRTADSPDKELSNLAAKTVAHDAQQSPFTTPEGLHVEFPLALNSAFLGADLKIVLGELKPHNFFGFSGITDIVFPGLTSFDSLVSHLSNRKGKSAPDLYAERVNIAHSIPNLLALSYVLDADLSPAQIAFGTISDCIDTLRGVTKEMCSKSVSKVADIVVMSAGGAPLDASLSRAVETFPAGVAACKRDGALIIAAECASGHGGGEFYDWCAEHKETRYLEMRLRHSFTYEGFKAAYLQRVLETQRIYLVSTIGDYYVERIFGMRSGRTANSAVQTAQRSLGSDSTVTVIPDASRIIPKLV